MAVVVIDLLKVTHVKSSSARIESDSLIRKAVPYHRKGL